MKTINLGTMNKGEAPLHCIIYGLAGCGKTHLMRNFPKPILLMDWDRKYEPLIGVEGVEVKSYYMEEPENAKQLIPQFWRDWQVAKKDPKWATIVIDSVTAIDRALERWAVLTCGKGKHASDRATLSEYGDMKRWYRIFFPSLRTAVDKNVIVLAHEQSKEDEGQLINIRPFITGKMGDEIASMFPHTFHLEHITGLNDRRVLHYKKYKKYVCASSAMSGGSGIIENPTYKKIIEVMKNS